MFHMSNESHLFNQVADLKTRDGAFKGNIYIAEGRDYLPLYEAKMVAQYNHRYGTLIGRENAGSRPSRKYEGWYGTEFENPTESAYPQYWVDRINVENKLGLWNKDWLIGFRSIARAVDERTVLVSIFPRSAVSGKLPLLLPHVGKTMLVTCLVATLNSLSLDYVARSKVGGTDLAFHYVKQFPILPPDRFSEADIAFIVPRVVELVYTAWDIKAFAEDVWREADEAMRTEILRRNAECNADAPADLFAPRDGFVLPPFCWSDERRAHIRAELDARIAKLYGLTRQELRYILDPADVYGPDFPGETFRLLKDKETRLYGEYRTRRLVLEAWDRENHG